MHRQAWIAGLLIVAACGDDEGPTEPAADPTVSIEIVAPRPSIFPPFSATRTAGQLLLKGTYTAGCAGVELGGEAWHEDGTLHVQVTGTEPQACEPATVILPYDATVTSAGGADGLVVLHATAGATAAPDTVFVATFH